MKLLIFNFAFLISFAAFGAKPLPTLTPKLQPLFEALKDKGVNYKPEGTVCEQVTVLQMRQTYPADSYAITTGVEYAIGDGVLGELDLVIVNLQNRRVEVAGEVKCWNNFYSAMDKAKMQRDRFLWNLSQFPGKIAFRSDDPDFSFAESDFRGLNQYIFVSQMGGVKKGFDIEIPYNLGEMRELQEFLVRCQKSGKCPLKSQGRKAPPSL